jgi:hypothetical protein
MIVVVVAALVEVTILPIYFPHYVKRLLLRITLFQSQQAVEVVLLVVAAEASALEEEVFKVVAVAAEVCINE